MENQDQLDLLFGRYRAACGEPEASRDFMPGLWKRIERRQGVTWWIGSLAPRFVGVAAGMCALLMAVHYAVAVPVSPISRRYVDVLEDTHSPETMAYGFEPASVEFLPAAYSEASR